jgi:hypothetical protein
MADDINRNFGARVSDRKQRSDSHASAPVPPAAVDFWAVIDQRIGERIEEERSITLTAVRGAIEALDLDGLSEAIATAREMGEREMINQVRDLRSTVDKLAAAMERLRGILELERSNRSVVDLPALPVARRVN